MRRLRFLYLVLPLLVVASIGYGMKGYWDALSQADELRLRADKLIAQGQGSETLGAEHRRIILAVEDPAFETHAGLDFLSPGSGLTTITQSLAKRLAFKQFHPGLSKIRQTGFALGLEQRLTKEEILTLWLHTLEIGKGPSGWIVGFFTASKTRYGRSPSELTDTEFIRLVAVLIAPSSYDLFHSDANLEERVTRIQRLVARACTPDGVLDVWLDGCRRLAN